MADVMISTPFSEGARSVFTGYLFVCCAVIEVPLAPPPPGEPHRP